MSMVPFKSVPEMLRENAVKFSGQTAVSYKIDNKWIALTYSQLYERVLMAARGLQKAGVRCGDRVAILSENRTGWAIADVGIQAVRAITVPVYATSTAEQVEYQLNHAGAKIVFISNRLQYEKLLKIRQQIPTVELAVSFERFLGEKSLPIYTLSQLSEVSHPLTSEEKGVIEAEIDRIAAEDLITIIYTSGTTGVPKGVMLTQHNMLYDAHVGLSKLGGMQPGEVFLSFLPLSHVLERTAGYYAALMQGAHVAFAESVEKVVENIQEIRPTVMVSVPRLFEKIYSRIHENVHLMPSMKKRLFHKAVEVGREYVHCRFVHCRPAGWKGVQYRLFDRLVFQKIRQRFGGRLRFFISGGAPLDKTINEFMWTIGIPTFEGYGLTETSPALTLNAYRGLRFGSVGTALDGTELKTAEDGELLARGPQLMRGYYRNPDATAEAMPDGWLRTGDIARIDEDGFVYIVDRKKEIIVTAGGKNIAPQPLENELKLDKYLSQAFVYGDRKPYLVALLTPNAERLIEFAHQEKLQYFDIEDLVANEQVKRLYTGRLGILNAKLPPYETIKKFVLLPRDFSIEGGELTPTMKLRRKVIYEKYKDRIEGLYLDDGNGPGPSQNGGRK